MDLDETDRKLLYVLQEESRMTLTHKEIAERIGVSSSTVSNRLDTLKEDGILVDYVPVLDYEKAGIPHRILFVYTAPINDRKIIAEQAITIHGVVGVQELLTGTQNLLVEVVASEAETIETVAEELDDLGVEIEMSEILRREYTRPFDDFSSGLADESDDR